MSRCWAASPGLRPTFDGIVLELEQLLAGPSRDEARVSQVGGQGGTSVAYQKLKAYVRGNRYDRLGATSTETESGYADRVDGGTSGVLTPGVVTPDSVQIQDNGPGYLQTLENQRDTGAGMTGHINQAMISEPGVELDTGYIPPSVTGHKEDSTGMIYVNQNMMTSEARTSEGAGYLPVVTDEPSEEYLPMTSLDGARQKSMERNGNVDTRTPSGYLTSAQSGMSADKETSVRRVSNVSSGSGSKVRPQTMDFDPAAEPSDNWGNSGYGVERKKRNLSIDVPLEPSRELDEDGDSDDYVPMASVAEEGGDSNCK